MKALRGDGSASRTGGEQPASAVTSVRKTGALAIFALIFLALAALGVRVALLEVVDRPRLLAWADNQQTGELPWSARRGFIVDRRGRVLAGTREQESLFADPSMIDDVPGAARLVAPVLGLPPDQVSQTLRSRANRRFAWLARLLDETQAAELRRLRVPGFGLIQECRRTYPSGSLAAHVLGFVGRDGIGLEGIEARYEKHLAGVAGRRRILRDAARRAICLLEDRSDPPRHGHHLVLTLDSVIQMYLEEALAGGLAKFEAESALGIVMDPRTGDVLALACLPTYDPNAFNSAGPDTRRNRVLTDPVEPGSVFKPFVGCVALAERMVRLDEQIFCHNGLYVTGKRELHDVRPHGWLTFEGIIAKSSNIGMAIVGQRLGNVRMHHYLKAFGFGEPTGVGLPGESDGLLMPLSKWNSYSTTSVPMGQELAITPIQLISALCAILNDGVLLRPRVVKAILTADGRPLETFAGPQERRRVLPVDVARTMARQVMVSVVTAGTGKQAALANYQVLGKTGTAQVPRRDRRGYEEDAYLSSFMGAAPAGDPRVAVLVMIRKPRSALGYYGGRVTAPVAREVLAKTLAYLKIPPDGETESLALADADG